MIEQKLLLKIIAVMSAACMHQSSITLNAVTLEYRSPADTLRAEADEIERCDKARKNYDDLLEELRGKIKK